MDDSGYFENDSIDALTTKAGIYTVGNVGNAPLQNTSFSILYKMSELMSNNPEVTLCKLICGTKQYNIAGYSWV